MGKRMLRSMVGGIWVALGMGACMGQDPVVGANRGETELGGAPSTEEEGPVVGGNTVDQSIQYYVNQVRPPEPGVDPTGFCLPTPLPLESNGLAACHIVQSPVNASGNLVVPPSCSCDGPDRAPPDPAIRATALQYLKSVGMCSYETGGLECEDLCLCELEQTADARRPACLSDGVLDDDGDGWCYLSPSDGLGPAATVAHCHPGEAQRVRFFGEQALHSVNVITCGGVTSHMPAGAGAGAALGRPCVPLDEADSTFRGFSVADVTLDLGTPACSSGICLANHFAGRVSCPYGQTSDDLESGAESCFVPGSELSVTVPVNPQMLVRRADEVVTCSCQCDGPGPGPYCDCPDSMVCAQLIDSVGLPAADAHVGSYCINRGTEYDVTNIPSFESCADQAARGELGCGDPRPY